MATQEFNPEGAKPIPELSIIVDDEGQNILVIKNEKDGDSWLQVDIDLQADQAFIDWVENEKALAEQGILPFALIAIAKHVAGSKPFIKTVESPDGVVIWPPAT